MTSPRRSALTWMMLCLGISILWGSYLESTSYAGMADFKAVYYGVRTLVHHSDPYNPAQFEAVYLSEGGKLPSDPTKLQMVRLGSFVCVNFPTALLLVSPFALLPWGLAHLLWMALTITSLAFATYLMWQVAGRHAPAFSLFLACVALANIEIFLALGNIAGIAVSFCIIGAWCFLEDRYVPAGVLCLAISIAMKPHVGGLIWLCFLLAGGVNRKRALQSLLVVGMLAIPSVLWVSHESPRWTQELQANVLAGSVHGGLNDPGPTSINFGYADMVISLQSAISIFRDEPQFYNSISYAICGILMLIGAIAILKRGLSKTNAWFAIASISALSMLPVYHRLHDAKILLLALPACALLWKEGGRLKWPAGIITGAAMLITADIPSTILTIIGGRLNDELNGFWSSLLTVAFRRPAAPVLLLLGIFYLIVFIQRSASEPVKQKVQQSSGKQEMNSEEVPSLLGA